MNGKTSKKPPNAGKGRVKGVPNKVTRDVRACIALVAQGFADDVLTLLRRGSKKDPLGAVNTYAKLIEYHIPKLSRIEHTGAGGGPVALVSAHPTDLKL
jgi:hypothetical protein